MSREGRRANGQFAKGNPGKAKGTRSRQSRAAETLLDGEAEALTRKAIEMAKAGDSRALRLCIERLLPPRKDRPVEFNLPPIMTGREHPEIMAAVLAEVAAGVLTPSEGQAVASMLEQHRHSIETVQVLDRLDALESRLSPENPS